MSREITFESIMTENLGHIKDVRLKDSGYLYLSDWYKLEEKTSLDLVILKPEDVAKLRNLLNNVNTEMGLKETVDNCIEQIFVSIVEKHHLSSGDIDFGAVDRLETIKEELVKIAAGYLRGNQPAEEE